jgi:hypothetical protein
MRMPNTKDKGLRGRASPQRRASDGDELGEKGAAVAALHKSLAGESAAGNCDLSKDVATMKKSARKSVRAISDSTGNGLCFRLILATVRRRSYLVRWVGRFPLLAATSPCSVVTVRSVRVYPRRRNGEITNNAAPSINSTIVPGSGTITGVPRRE